MAGVLSEIPPRVLEKLDELEGQYAQLAEKLQDPGVLTDHVAVRDLSIKKAAMEPVVADYRRFRALLQEAGQLRAAAEPGAAREDPELAEMAREELPRVEAAAAELFEAVKARLVTAEDRKVGSVMLELRAGAGGDEAGLWTRDLLTMYEKYAAARGWSFEPLDIAEDEGPGGVRHAVINVRGEGVYAELGFEAGVHSVKRVPATEAQGRIHTSTATVAVLPEPEEVQLSIDWDKDVQEHVTTSQGPGGQNVNKVATAVQLVHLPTGLVVRMQESKSQHQNRAKARRLLMARLYELERQRQAAERSAERRGQIGTGERSEKIRVYRYQEGIVADQRLSEKFPLRDTLAGQMHPLIQALTEQETARRLAEL